MRIIAKKSFDVGVLYNLCLVAGLVLSILGFNNAPLMYFGVPVFIVSLVIMIEYYSIPANVIKINDKNELFLPKNIILSLNDIYDVSYRRASARSVQYKWGTVKISSSKGIFKYRYISECERVTKEILKLIYIEKNDKSKELQRFI